ncbi:hypothetical protein CP10881SC42_0940 [Chlamydia avium]|uniref:Uncharacterized protein n=1 Tax=Chlamydia avium TaxID=1457141 RepID=A0ABP2X5Z7_9CHLA|nr:hypothetical protein CP10743SC13_0859 [Chlamydia psittaci 10_743_SC13]EPP38229.1 hypothetical protein CP10881SC42_0940 [Chlamydia avium]
MLSSNSFSDTSFSSPLKKQLFSSKGKRTNPVFSLKILNLEILAFLISHNFINSIYR